MKYDFDEMVDRRGTHSIKWDAMPKGAPDGALPLWVADMDLPCAEPIIQSLHQRVDRKIYGYTEYKNDECLSAVIDWYARRFEWKIEKDTVFFSPGVVPALAILINILTEEGDGVIVQQPVYHPFVGKVESNKRTLINSPLIYNDHTYQMDYEDLERDFSLPGTKGMILCSPHNPVGRVWSETELRRLVEIAKKHDKWIISDEIHSDLTRIGVNHTPLLKLAPDYQDQIIVCTAPSKTFNLAGMQFSNIIIPNKTYQNQWMEFIEDRFSLSICSPLGMTAVIAAYTQGEEWLDQAREYIDGNIRYVEEYVKTNLPNAAAADCQGTYLMWLDLRGYCKDPHKLENAMHEVGRLALDDGYRFGREGEGFERINVATPRRNVVECMTRMKKALDSLTE